MTEPDCRMSMNPLQQSFEKSKSLIVHALVMYHETGYACCKGLIELCKQPLPFVLGIALLSGVQVDIGGKVRQSAQRGQPIAAVAGNGEKALFFEDVQGVLVQAVPWRGEHR